MWELIISNLDMDLDPAKTYGFGSTTLLGRRQENLAKMMAKMIMAPIVLHKPYK
jgi:hypothetical protein